MTKRLGPRFGLEAGFLIGVAVVLGLLEVSWPAIVVAMAIAWLVVAGSEIVLARRPIEAKPEPEPAPEPQPEPPVPPAPAAPFPCEPREWNLWELERIAREHAGTDPARDDERTSLLLSLRDHAQPDGNLPLEFDPLVRDAFGDLLHTTA